VPEKGGRELFVFASLTRVPILLGSKEQFLVSCIIQFEQLLLEKEEREVVFFIAPISNAPIQLGSKEQFHACCIIQFLRWCLRKGRETDITRVQRIISCVLHNSVRGDGVRERGEITGIFYGYNLSSK
jgi:hypothetical protein